MITGVSATDWGGAVAIARASNREGVSEAVSCQWGCNSCCCTDWSSQVFKVGDCEGTGARDNKGGHVNAKLENKLEIFALTT